MAATAMLLALVSLALVLTNQNLRRQTDEQRQFIQQTAQFNGVNEALVRLIARAAIDEKDQQLRDLLVSHGFRFEGGIPAQAVAPAQPPASSASSLTNPPPPTGGKK